VDNIKLEEFGNGENYLLKPPHPLHKTYARPSSGAHAQRIKGIV